MKIKLRILFYGGTKAQVARDPSVASAVALDAPNWIDGDSPLAERISSLTRRGEELWITPEADFTPAETRKAAWFQFVCRKTVREKESDRQLNMARLKSLPFFTTGGGARVRFLDRVVLTGLSLRPNEIAGVDEWTEDYVLPTAMEAALLGAGLTGFRSQPVLDPKAGREYAEYRLLYSESFLPPAEIDLSFRKVPEEGFGLRQLGCLAYDYQDLCGLPDFNRSAEPWYSNDMPAWIVSGRMVGTFKAGAFKGLAFKPVLDRQGPLYAEYLRRWEEVLRLFPGLNRSSPLNQELLP